MKIVVEPPLTGTLLARVFPELKENLVEKQTPDAALQWAADYVRRGEKVLLVLDAGSYDPNVVDETRRSSMRLLRESAGSGFDVIVGAPTILSRLFEHQEVTKGFNGSFDAVAAIYFDPFGELQKALGAASFDDFLSTLSPEALRALRTDQVLSKVFLAAERLPSAA